MHQKSAVTYVQGQTWRPRSRRSPVRFSVSKATDDELWKILEEDCFEWSDQYNDYLVYYYDSAEGEDSEIHPSVWKWLVSAMGKVEEAMDLEGGSSIQPA